MLRVLSHTRKISSVLNNFPNIKRSQVSPLSLCMLKTSRFLFSEGKNRLPKNKEEAWMMQQQKKLKESPNDDDDGQTYNTFSKYGVMALALMGGSFLYLIHWAEKKSEQNLDFYQQDISGLKELKEDKPQIGGDWTLIDTNGQPLSSHDLSGYYYLVYFGFTNCPDICPSVLYYISTVYRVIRNIPEGAYMKLKLVFVSIDPERDNPQKVKKFLSYFNKNMIGVTATGPNDPQLAGMMKQFKIYKKKVYKAQDKKEDYNIDHTTRIFLMDPQNKYMYHIEPSLSEQQAAKAIVAKIVQNQHRTDKQVQKLTQ